MVDQFNKLPGSYESELNIDDLDHDQDIGALQWSTSRGQPVVSLYRAIILYTRQQPAQRVVGVLIEYTLSRIWALRSRIPKRNDADDEWDITDAEKTQLGRDLFFLNEKMLTKSFNEELKNPAIDDENDDEELDDEEQYDDDDDDDMNDDDDEDEEDESYDSKFEEFKSNMEQTLVNDTIWRWNYTWKVYETQLNTLTTQLECLQAIRDTVDNKITSVNVNTIENEAVKSMINLWITKGDDWPAQLASPKLDLPDIKDFLTIDGSSRSVQAQRWLELQRIAHSEATDWRSDIFGSAYSARWEPNATPKNTPPDHVVPQKWMESSRLIFESRDPRQLPAVVLCRLQENSAKSDSRLGLVFTDDRTSRSNNVWVPPQPISDKKKAMLAKTIAWVFLLYWGVSSNKADRNIYKFHGNVKESLYLLAWNKRNARFTTMKDLVKTESTAHEKRFALLSLAMPSWQVANPLIFDPSLMSQEFDNLLTKRFSGEDDLSWLIDRVLYLAVAGAPDIHK